MLLERDAPLDALLAAARRAASGHGSMVLLAGEAGIGKTTLLREFTGRVDSGFKVLWGWCEALFTPRPLGPPATRFNSFALTALTGRREPRMPATPQRPSSATEGSRAAAGERGRSAVGVAGERRN